MGWAGDERVIAALRNLVDLYRELGIIDCRWGRGYQLNGYCHMLTVKELLFLGEVPRELWPDGAEELRDACVAKLRDKQVFRSLPVESREFNDAIWSMPERGAPGSPRTVPGRAPRAALQGQARLAALRLSAVVQLRRARSALGADARR